MSVFTRFTPVHFFYTFIMLLDGIEPQESHGDQGQPASSQLGLVVGGHSDHVEEQFSLPGARPRNWKGHANGLLDGTGLQF